jgi:hypothetical protein
MRTSHGICSYIPYFIIMRTDCTIGVCNECRIYFCQQVHFFFASVDLLRVIPDIYFIFAAVNGLHFIPYFG